MTSTGEQKNKSKKLKIVECCQCKAEIQVIHKTATAKCWDCNVKSIKTYQNKHRGLKVNTNYAKQVVVKK
jgi:uncharacterized paraquat-inducible protein A